MATPNVPSIFSMETCNLGTDSIYGGYGVGKKDIDDDILHCAYDNKPKCISCQGIPVVRIVPKDPKDSTAETDKGVFFCRYCLAHSGIDSNKYGIKPI